MQVRPLLENEMIVANSTNKMCSHLNVLYKNKSALLRSVYITVVDSFCSTCALKYIVEFWMRFHFSGKIKYLIVNTDLRKTTAGKRKAQCMEASKDAKALVSLTLPSARGLSCSTG